MVRRCQVTHCDRCGHAHMFCECGVKPADEAKKLHEEGWLPISNQHFIVALAPKTMNFVEALARGYTKDEPEDQWCSKLYPKGDSRRGRKAHYEQELRHWSKFTKDAQRDHYARMFATRKTISPGVYMALKKLVGAFNRGVK